MNKFTDKYNEIIDDEFEAVLINNNQNIIYKYNPRVSDLALSYDMALEKANYTMSASQAGEQRKNNEKIANAFKGILAELVSHRFFLKIIGESRKNIYRYDIERTNFKYNTDEYDLKIAKNNMDYFVEIRSSLSYKTTIEQAYNQFDIIGKYTNSLKPHENLSDIYIRPIYQYKALKEKLSKEEKNHIVEDLKRKAVEIYIISGAFKEDFKEKGYQKSMGQGSTKYNAIKIKEIGDAFNFKNRYENKIY